MLLFSAKMKDEKFMVTCLSAVKLNATQLRIL
jgi:hypothetical protein